jgi:hypothetical protein
VNARIKINLTIAKLLIIVALAASHPDMTISTLWSNTSWVREKGACAARQPVVKIRVELDLIGC